MGVNEEKYQKNDIRKGRDKKNAPQMLRGVLGRRVFLI